METGRGVSLRKGSLRKSSYLSLRLSFAYGAKCRPKYKRCRFPA